jgi:hypothetical protein
MGNDDVVLRHLQVMLLTFGPILKLVQIVLLMGARVEDR